MADSWYLMDALTTGGFENAEFADWHGAFENDLLPSFAADDVLVYGSKMTNTPTSVRAIIQSVTADSYNTMMTRQILCSIGTIVCGDYVKVGDRWWVVVSLVDENGVYEKGILYYCNGLLNFTSPLTLQTVTYPAVIHNATQYNSGERARDYMVVVSSQKLIYLPFNQETCLLDNDYRFLIDRNTRSVSSWKVAQADTENDWWDGTGIVRLMVVEDEHAPSDDNAEMVADNSSWLKKRGFDVRAAGGGWID